MRTKKSKKTKDDLVEIALNLSAKLGWAHISLQDIAAEADLSLAELHEYFEDKTDILVALGRIIDRKVLENAAAPDDLESARDRLFDVLMERYEVLNEFRPGLVSILESFKLDPKQAVISLPHLCRSMTWMMEAAGLHANGWRGAIKLTGLTGVYIKGLKTWVRDESPDLAQTMAALDKDLGRVEKAANMFGL